MQVSASILQKINSAPIDDMSLKIQYISKIGEKCWVGFLRVFNEILVYHMIMFLK